MEFVSLDGKEDSYHKVVGIEEIFNIREARGFVFA